MKGEDGLYHISHPIYNQVLYKLSVVNGDGTVKLFVINASGANERAYFQMVKLVNNQTIECSNSIPDIRIFCYLRSFIDSYGKMDVIPITGICLDD